MSKQFLIIIAVLVLGFIGFIGWQGSKKKTDNNSGNGSASQASEHKVGAGNKGVTLVEYGDFQCPSCGVYYPVIDEVIKKYGDDITFQFRNFPLTQIHPNAMAAHRAAEAAAKQGKFWEMYSLLYRQQQVWSNSPNMAQVADDYAKQLGLKLDQFKKDYKSSEVNATINADLAAGHDLKVTGTPTFFINGQRVEKSPQNLEEFSKLIDDAIAKGNQSSNQ